MKFEQLNTRIIVNICRYIYSVSSEGPNRTFELRLQSIVFDNLLLSDQEEILVHLVKDESEYIQIEDLIIKNEIIDEINYEIVSEKIEASEEEESMENTENFSDNSQISDQDETTKSKCNVCGKKFKHLLQHLYVHGQYNCQECFINFKTKKKYDNHVKTHITEVEKDILFKCEICNIDFYTPMDIALHNFTHTESYSCVLCNFTAKFKTKRTLINHIRRHEGKFNVKCDICGQGLLSTNALKVHMEIHANIPKYQCDFCPKKFTVERYLHVHKQLNHKKELFGVDEIFQCEICGRQFSFKKSLERHLSCIHKIGEDRTVACSISRKSGSKPRKRGSTWDEDSLRRAMEAVQNNQLSTNAAALRFNIPRRTLRSHLLSGNSTKSIGKTTILTKQLEGDLSQQIKRFAKLGIPLTPKFIRKQAFLFCERFKIKHSFNMSTRMAGRKWLKMFLIRNPSISKINPQLINLAGAQKNNKPIVKHYFEEVKKLYEELDIIAHPERLYNMDEKGCRITVHKQNVVLAEKGSTRVHLDAPEHAENVTIAMCVNAVGSAIPPMIIFKGIRYRSELASDLPPGTKVSVAPKGSMTSSLFVEFIQHFARHKASGKCLLIFDGAKCQLTYEALEEADKNNIILFCLPFNTTHALQPLDNSVTRSFEHHWDEEVSNYLCNSLERTLNGVAFNKIFSRTWPKCMTQTNITNGFKATGLYPLDPDVIPEDAYAPSIITEGPLPETLQDQIDRPLISFQVSTPVLSNKVSKLPSPPLIDESRPAHASHASSQNNYMSKRQVSDLYTSSSAFDEDPDQKEKTTPKKQLIGPKTKTQQKSHEISDTESSDDDEPLINLIQDKEKSFHTFLPNPN
ncbi:uncharacterized protein LOC115879903 [Sitophilus oryzae]|uniref:Uncharacterized protein LOC115879903 n=1 Tax=Sitophilus oryzae TaxID=7048 RepID=A0A6J2XN78_SITOR|nr:uncharacterized protein LOC115879903 [Sitophilus oryzae]